jgi:hypothetical protein
MSAAAMTLCSHDSPVAMICDPREPDAPSRGAQNALQAIGQRWMGLYPHPKLFMSIAIRVRVGQSSSAKISRPRHIEQTTTT